MIHTQLWLASRLMRIYCICCPVQQTVALYVSMFCATFICLLPFKATELTTAEIKISVKLYFMVIIA